MTLEKLQAEIGDLASEAEDLFSFINVLHESLESGNLGTGDIKGAALILVNLMGDFAEKISALAEGRR